MTRRGILQGSALATMVVFVASSGWAAPQEPLEENAAGVAENDAGVVDSTGAQDAPGSTRVSQPTDEVSAGVVLGVSEAEPAAAESVVLGDDADSEDAQRVAETAAPADVEDEDDDWDTSGPVDRTPRISGVLSSVFRATYFSDHVLPLGSRVEDSNNFQLEHTHIKFFGDLAEELSWELMPCMAHMNEFSMITAHFSYQVASVLRVTAGRFLLPFGQFNLRSLPGSYGMMSRPLLYLSHEERPIAFEQAPLPGTFLFTPRDSVGLLLSGNYWLGPDDVVQLSYSAYVTNGLRAVSDMHGRFWNDNNKWKQFGGRASASYNGDPFGLTVGGSYLRNRYEKQLDQQAWSIDAVASYQYMTARRVSVRGEYVDTVREIQPNEQLLKGDEGLRGAYVVLEVDLLAHLGIFYQWDTIEKRSPRAQLNEQFRDLEVTVNRHTAGARLIIAEYLELHVEYGVWLHPLGLPNTHRLAIQTIVSF